VVYGEKFVKRGLSGAVSFFDVMCERKTFEVFEKILNSNNRFVNMQLIQTTSIFLYNIT
jgi:ribosome-binding factor A